MVWGVGVIKIGPADTVKPVWGHDGEVWFVVIRNAHAWVLRKPVLCAEDVE